MASKWLQMKDYIVIEPTTENGTAEIRPRALTHFDFSVLRLFAYVTITFFSTAGTVTNLVNILVFRHVDPKDTVSISLLALSVSDFLFSFLGVAAGIGYMLTSLELFYGPYIRWVDPNLIVYCSDSLCNLLYTLSVLITMFIAVARCACVLMPLRFKNTFTPKVSKLIIAVCTVVSFFVKFPSIAAVYITPKFVKAMNDSRYIKKNLPLKRLFRDIATAFNNTSLPFASQVVLLVCVLVMAWAMSRAAAFRRKGATDPTFDEESGKTASKFSQKELQVIKQVLVVCVVFLVCNTPKLMVGSFVLFFEEVQNRGKKEGMARVYTVFKKSRRLFESINGAVNIGVYLNYNRKYREIVERRVKTLFSQNKK